jgi:hypothetical protein
MKRLLFVVIFLPGCSWFQPPEIIDPKTGVTYKGREAVRVYAHEQQQAQLMERWKMLEAMAKSKPSSPEGEVANQMLMQSIVLADRGAETGGEYFKMLAKMSGDKWGFAKAFVITAMPWLAPWALGYDYGGSGGDVSEEINAGRDIIVTGGPGTVSAPPAIGEPPAATGPAPGFYPSVSFGGIGNNTGSPEALNALYNSTAAQNQQSGTLQLDNEKPVNFKDTTCGSGGCVDDADGGNDTSLF